MLLHEPLLQAGVKRDSGKSKSAFVPSASSDNKVAFLACSCCAASSCSICSSSALNELCASLSWPAALSASLLACIHDTPAKAEDIKIGLSRHSLRKVPGALKLVCVHAPPHVADVTWQFNFEAMPDAWGLTEKSTSRTIKHSRVPSAAVMIGNCCTTILC